MRYKTFLEATTALSVQSNNAADTIIITRNNDLVILENGVTLLAYHKLSLNAIDKIIDICDKDIARLGDKVVDLNLKESLND